MFSSFTVENRFALSSARHDYCLSQRVRDRFLENKHEEDDIETRSEFEERLTYHVIQMMYVSGETAEASAETTGMIEEIVRQQVIEMVSILYLPSNILLTRPSFVSVLNKLHAVVSNRFPQTTSSSLSVMIKPRFLVSELFSLGKMYGRTLKIPMTKVEMQI
jgi:hypothetical protein